MTDVRDAPSGKISATGIEFRGKSFSESMGDGGEPTGTSSSTGITDEVRGREYGLGRVSDWSAWSAKTVNRAGAGVTWSRAAWIFVSWESTTAGAGEDGDKWLDSMVIGRM